MKTLLIEYCSLPAIVLCFCAGLSACGNDEDETKLSPERIQFLTHQAVMETNQVIANANELLTLKYDAFLHEGIDISFASQGRKKAVNCQPASIDISVSDETHYDTLIYAGMITLDFKDNTACPLDQHVRKGKIVIEFTYIISYKQDTTFASRETIIFNKFVRDSIEYNGRITSRQSSAQPNSIEANFVEMKYPDHSTSTWSGLLYASEDVQADGTFLTGSLSGYTRTGFCYTADIQSPFFFRYDCFGMAPAAGIVNVKVNRAVATVDYGNGSCDNHYDIVTLAEAL